MFKVKATVVAMLGDIEKYPCHFNYKIGDEIIWTGAEFKGRICPGVFMALAPKVIGLYSAGPRYVEANYYVPFWYAPPSVYDPSMKKYDGIGFRNVLHSIEDLQYGMSLLRPANSFNWPPHPERTVSKDNVVVCGDARTSVVLKLEAFDLADDGDCVTYFRRTMSILNKVLHKPGVAVDKIINEFTKEEIEGIYPALSQILVGILVEELELMEYLKIQNMKATVTDKGAKKLEDFKKSLTAEERKALKMQTK
ncbi:MAG: hypothetical protein A2144_03685 [Chloroflexi bacterium RBG_16_50_9]|nr:MAG: hypothetical protein A2144_03685 [Chloroflexi bacterium RBG_16_50_9]